MKRMLPHLTLLIFIGLASLTNLAAAADNHLVDRSKAVANDAKDVVVDAGQSVADGAETLWNDIGTNGLTHRTRDEIVLWTIIGALVGAVAGLLASMRSTRSGWSGRLLLGLLGAFLGGVAVRLSDLNLGWGPVVVPYEELLFSFAGAVVLIILARLARAKPKKKQA